MLIHNTLSKRNHIQQNILLVLHQIHECVPHIVNIKFEQLQVTINTFRTVNELKYSKHKREQHYDINHPAINIIQYSGKQNNGQLCVTVQQHEMVLY